VDLSCLLALELNFEPFVQTAIQAQGGQLDLCLAYLVVFAHILIHDYYTQVVPDVLDIQIE